jgi:hypothetical protein
VEAFGGAYEEAVLAKKVNRSEIEQTALERIMSDFRWV